MRIQFVNFAGWNKTHSNLKISNIFKKETEREREGERSYWSEEKLVLCQPPKPLACHEYWVLISAVTPSWSLPGLNINRKHVPERTEGLSKCRECWLSLSTCLQPASSYCGSQLVSLYWQSGLSVGQADSQSFCQDTLTDESLVDFCRSKC